MKLLVSLMVLLALGSVLPVVAAPETSMFVTSNDFSTGGTIPPRFTCEGSGSSPNLRIAMVPRNAQSLVMIMDDPDAPKGTFTHWLVWNISPDATEFSTDSVPAGVVQGTNDAGKTGYFPPCPPSGQHRYYFRVFALAKPIKLPPSARRADVDKAIEGIVLAEATLMGRFGRAISAPTP
jgi:Raf kinase inhibitor-like YbhB/YbcL family protein